MTVISMFERLDRQDRAWRHRWALSHSAGALRLRTWIAITHAGGAVTTIAAVAVPWLFGLWPTLVYREAAAILVVSHLAVQTIKRRVNRTRPDGPCHIALPDRFSFPSGHATAALAVAIAYGVAFPALALPLTALAVLVGWSRVVLGVHYPGDVMVGQVIAVGTAIMVYALR